MLVKTFSRNAVRCSTAFDQVSDCAASCNLAKRTSSKVFVKPLSIERLGTQSARCNVLTPQMLLQPVLLAAHVVLSTSWRLLDTMSSDKMSEKGVAAIESPLGCKHVSGTESTPHGLLEVTERMPDAVVGPGESLDMVLAVADGALFGSLSLVGK